MGRQAVAVVFAALLLAGCEIGGGEDTGREQFVQDADAVCQRYSQRISGIPQPQTFLRDFAVYMRRAVPVARQQNRELERLPSPEDVEEDFRRMIVLLDQQLDLAAQAGEEAYAGREARAQAAFQQSLAPASEASRLAARIGFATCGRAA